MTFLLDTNTCIQYLNGRSENIFKKLSLVESNKVYLCSIVKAELMFGAIKSKRSPENISKLQLFFDQFYSYPFDDNCFETYAKIRNKLEEIGKPIGPNDLLIASIALANDLTLVTHNLKEFSRINNLKLEDWE